MHSIFSYLTRAFVLAALLAAGPSMAGTTSIAQVPILSIDDTGTVKPNLMLIYDNSGSMAYTYTPDYVNDSTTCRSRLTMGTVKSPTTMICAVGHPPYNSPDFNRQSYNPAVLYLPPVDSTGASYPSLNRANTTAWSVVKNDGFGVDTSPLSGSGTTINLVTGFPDLRWCDNPPNGTAQTCVYNSASYNYPNATYYTAKAFSTNPYYYSIMVSEYCTDATLVTCQSVVVGAAAPTGYPIAAKVRFCNSVALTNCQAKYVGAYIYPRFGDPAVTPAASGANGLITIGTSASTKSLTITSVSVAESGGPVEITNGPVVASGGTPDITTQAALANALAASIIAKTGLVNQYLACVRTPTVSGVPACSTYGITLGNDNVVAVVAIDCTPGATSKAIGQCSLLADDSRNGWGITAFVSTTGTPASGVITVGGTAVTSTKNPTTLGASTLGTATLFSSVTFASGSSSANAAAAIAAAINNKGTAGITAIQGGQTGCSSASTSTVCVTTSVAYDSGQSFSFGTISNNSTGSGKLTVTGGAIKAGTAPVTAVNVKTTAIGAGTSIFVRTDIVATRNSYPKAKTRTDCASTTCSYDEEMTNFANWYSYYKTRNQMMKTSVGLAFNPIDSNYNVGVVSLADAAATTTSSAKFGRPLPFTGSQRTAWYASLYAMSVGGSTPLRTALDWVGQMYANKVPFNYASGSEAVQALCQQNFTFITTDGYWNGAAASAVASNDNKVDASRFCTQATGCVDTSDQKAATLADVALYWYNGGSNTTTVSLRPTLEPDLKQPGLVKGPDGDNKHLHMNTYTLGLGVDGIMNYEANYDTAPKAGGDFSKLINGTQTGCPWNNNGPYVWPDPVPTDSDGGAAYQTRVDDLWHTAINGRGKYFSASDPTEVIAGLRSALSHIAAHVGAASAAATSTPNISVEDNDLFSNTFTTVQWTGEMTDKKVDVVTAAISSTATWSVSKVLGSRVTATGDTRQIKMLDVKTGALVDFLYENLPSSMEQGWFDNRCDVLTQCTKLADADRTLVSTGSTIIGWLRGQQQYANDTLLRAYAKTTVAPLLPIILGDIASSKPAYVRDPRKTYSIAGYADFVSKMSTGDTKRAPAVYVGANDGMLHAFNATTGDENWAYVPRMTMKKLAAQASTDYGTNHQFSVDGSPEVGDVQIVVNGVTDWTSWHSILVGGLNGGGRGYYALDVTDPNNPKAMWETCSDPAICTGVNNEPELGLTFGNPQIGTWVDGSGNTKWVVFVTSGYNNVPDKVSGGTGAGFLMVLDIQTGAVLAKTSTKSGSTDTPSGLARITGITADPASDPHITFVYGGDVLGQMWRFDTSKLSDPTYVPVLMGNAGNLQPITVRPDVTMCSVNTTAANGTVSTSNKVVVAFGTGRLLDVADVTNKDSQSIYVLRDTDTSIAAGVWRGATMVNRALAKTTASTGDTYTVSGSAVDFSTQIGWYTDLNQNVGERVNLDPKIVTGSLDVVSNIPSASSACSVGGKSNIYTFDVCKGTGDASGVVGRTLSNTSAAVGFIVVSLSSGAKKIIATLADGSQVVPPSGDLKTPVTRRTGWRRIRN